MCNEKLTPNEYRQWRQYINDTCDNVCKCEFKKILELQKKIKKETKEILEFEKQNLEYHEKIEKEKEFYHSLEKKSFFKNLKEKVYLINFKRNFKKVSYCGKRFYNLIVKK